MNVIKLPTVSNVIAGQMATIDLRPCIGRVLDRICLTLGGTFTKAQITGIRLKMNTKTVWEDTGARLDAVNQYRQLPAGANNLTLDFTEPRAKDIFDQFNGSIDLTRFVGTLSLELDIAAGATAPTLAAVYEYSWPTKQSVIGYDLIGKRVIQTTQALATTTKLNIPLTLGNQPNSKTLIKRIHHLIGSGTIVINGGELKQGGITVWEATLALNNFLLGEYQKTPQAGWLHMDFIADGNMMDAILDTNKTDANGNRLTLEMNLDVTVAVGGNIITIYELLDPNNSN